jgi:hypothetical protein
MLVIRAEQIAAFESAAQQRFLNKICGLLRSELQRELSPIDDHTLCTQVEAAWRKAGRYGIESQRDIHRFARQWVLWGDGYDERSEPQWVRQYLNDPNMTGSEKLDRLEYHYYIMGDRPAR